MKMLVCFILITFVWDLTIGNVMQTVFEWNEISFVPSPGSSSEQVKKSVNFNYIQPLDVDRDHTGRVFMTFFAQKDFPVTLGIVTNISTPSGPLVKPYPDWSWFEPNNCTSLRNVFRIAIDKCNRLWVLDDGMLSDNPINCTARIVVFDLNTDKLSKFIEIPDDISKNETGFSLLANIIVDAEGADCKDTTVIVANTFGEILIVYRDNNNEICGKKHPDFSYDPKAIYVTSGNLSAYFNAGLLGMAVSHSLHPQETKSFYFSPLASFSIMSISLDDLKCIPNKNLTKVKKFTDVLPNHSIVMAFSSKNTLFFGMTEENAIGCWNRYRSLTRQNLGIVDRSIENLQYLNGIKVKEAITPLFPEEELWVLSNRFLAFEDHLLNRDNKNFKILKASVKNIIKENPICDIPQDNKLFDKC